jgi:hypothetical protein
MWLNLCGHQAIRHKLKKGVKTLKMHFYPVFELMSDSLKTIKVEAHQCPSCQFILLIQVPISEIFRKKYWEFGELKISVFLSRPFWSFFFCFIPIKISHKLTGYHWWDSIFMIIMISRKKLGGIELWNTLYHILGNSIIPAKSLKLKEFVFKVAIFWEGHKNLKKSTNFFWHYFVKTSGRFFQIFAAFTDFLNFKKFC